MKQILQKLDDGETILADVPAPQRPEGSVLIETSTSLVSLGTERMLIEFGKGGWIAKARSQPEKVQQVLQKIKTDGLWTTLEAVRAKLDVPIPLGYCNVGRVLEADQRSPFRSGERVASNGPHAELVAVGENLCARIPEKVSDETASFTVTAAIGLQGIRLLQPTLGERIVVSGLGLIGLLSVQMLRAHGCQVMGIDFDQRKLELARQFGAQTVDLSAGQDPVRAAAAWTNGNGVDGVLIAAAAKSDDVIQQAANMCRKRGRIVLVGVIGLNLRRADFYEKELSFQVSCSYGPGRYDDAYEKQGIDYPIGFVRWTEQRNLQAVLELMADGKIDVAPLISHRFKFADALKAYEVISRPDAMGIVLGYQPAVDDKHQQRISVGAPIAKASGDIGVAFIGAGAFTTRVLLPQLPTKHVFRKTIVSRTGVSAAYAAEKFSFQETSSSSDVVLQDPEIDAVFITTPHNSHGGLVCSALQSGKHVFVEKPLALGKEEVDAITSAMDENPERCVMVGFNRRFSPHTAALKTWLQASPGPKSIVITVNAGAIPEDHWTQDREIGGGRILGEACHFIDLARFLAESPITNVTASPMTAGEGRLGDCAAIQLRFADGSIATVHYLANGSKDFPKERVEIFAAGKVLVCENFRISREIGGRRKHKTFRQDKGHAAGLAAFIDAISPSASSTASPAWPIPREQLIEVARATIDASEQVWSQLPN